MKKYILNDEYKKFRRRITISLWVLTSVILITLNSTDASFSFLDYLIDGIFLSFIFTGIPIWGVYFIIRWIYKALPK